MKKRWISLYVENRSGVLARISGLFSAKAYNLDSLTVGATEDPTVSRMTIGVTSDDNTFEQIKKQLNRLVEVIKVIDITESPIITKEVLFIKIKNCSNEKMKEAFRFAEVYQLSILDYGLNSIILECVKSSEENNEIIRIFSEVFSVMEVIRGGAVAIEKIRR